MTEFEDEQGMLSPLGGASRASEQQLFNTIPAAPSWGAQRGSLDADRRDPFLPVAEMWALPADSSAAQNLRAQLCVTNATLLPDAQLPAVQDCPYRSNPLIAKRGPQRGSTCTSTPDHLLCGSREKVPAFFCLRSTRAVWLREEPSPRLDDRYSIVEGCSLGLHRCGLIRSKLGSAAWVDEGESDVSL